jgi:hypothetical protein
MVESVRVVGLDDALRIIKDTESATYKDLISNIKGILEPTRTKIVRSVPFMPPLSGMLHNGRTAWTGIEAITEVTPFSYRGSSGSRRVVSIGIFGKPGAGFEIADMAGRKSTVGRSGLSREYTRGGRRIRHRLNGQGTSLINNIPNKPSRYAYPAVEKDFLAVQVRILKMLDSTVAKINRRLDRI